MRVTEYQPPTTAAIPETEPVAFLSGPIQGARLWQIDAVQHLEQIGPNNAPLAVANPRRGIINDIDFKYEEQVAWEKQHLVRAAKHGAIIFWFAAQDMDAPYEKGRAYAQTSRVEFGRTIGWLDHDPNVRVSIGIEPGYRGSERYFQSCAREHGLPIFTTLEDVCIEAVRKLR